MLPTNIFVLSALKLNLSLISQNTKSEKKVKSLSCVRLLVTPWTAAYQAPPSMGFFQARVLKWGATAFSNHETFSLSKKLLSDSWY